MKTASGLGRTGVAAFCIFAFLLLFSPVRSQQVPETQPDSAMAWLKHLAAPETYAGRKSGVKSGTEAMEWVKTRFANWGLQPFILRNLLVPFNMLVCEERKAYLAIDDGPFGRVEFLLGDDYTLCVNSGSGKVEAPVVVVGHGISSPEKGWDDYSDVDVTGRIVVVLRGKPTRHEDWDHEYLRTTILPEAVSRGAAAVLFYQNENPTGGAAIGEEAYEPDIPSGYVGERVMRHLFRGSDMTFEQYRDKLRENPYPLELATTLRFQAATKRIDNAVGYNVAGLVRGTDADLSTEAVIIGGHGDHVGKNANGQIYAGADDNASGASVIMELARVFAQYPQKRSLVFVVFGAEEQGLLGSKALAAMLPDNFTYVNMVNLDMVGRGDGTVGLGGGDQLAEVWDPWYASLSDDEQAKLEGYRAWGGWSSDHAPFRNEGIPAFTGYSRGKHSYYHTIDDLYETIDREAIEGTLNAVSRWIVAVSNFSEPLGDRNLEARTIWRQGYPISWKNSVNNVDRDMALVDSCMTWGYVTSVLTLPERGGLPGYLALLDKYNDAIEANPGMNLATSLRDIGGNTYYRKASVFLAYDGDNLFPTDTTKMQAYREMGMSWTMLASHEQWIRGANVAPERVRLLKIMASDGGVVQLTLRHATQWLPILEEIGSSAVFVGNWRDLASLSDATLETIREHSAGIVAKVEPLHMKDAAAAADRIATYKIHLQPAEGAYNQTMGWIESAKAAGIETETLVNWIGKNQRHW